MKDYGELINLERDTYNPQKDYSGWINVEWDNPQIYSV